MENFNDYLDKQGFSVFIDYVLEFGQKWTLKKNEYFSYQNTPAQYMGYVQKGAVRYTRIDEEGKEHVVGYSFINDFVTDYPSFIHRTPRLVNIQALQNTVLYTVTYARFMKLVKENEVMREVYHRTTEAYASLIYRRLLSFYCEKPEERYLRLIRECPNIMKLIPLKEVASYIGVTPETLSHIRKRLKEDGLQIL